MLTVYGHSQCMFVKGTAVDDQLCWGWGVFRNQMPSFFSLSQAAQTVLDGSLEHSQFEQFLKETWKS